MPSAKSNMRALVIAVAAALLQLHYLAARAEAATTASFIQVFGYGADSTCNSPPSSKAATATSPPLVIGACTLGVTFLQGAGQVSSSTLLTSCSNGGVYTTYNTANCTGPSSNATLGACNALTSATQGAPATYAMYSCGTYSVAQTQVFQSSNCSGAAQVIQTPLAACVNQGSVASQYRIAGAYLTVDQFSTLNCSGAASILGAQNFSLGKCISTGSGSQLITTGATPAPSSVVVAQAGTVGVALVALLAVSMW